MATVLERNRATVADRPAASQSRMSSRARGRLALGALVVAIGVLINLAVYRGMNDKTPVLQLVRDVPAGQQLTSDDFRSIDIGSDGSFRAVAPGDEASIVGSYAKVRLVAGTLLAREALQGTPLVAPGAAVVAVTVPSGELPSGLRERSRVSVVLIASDQTSRAVDGRIVGLPSASTSTGQSSVSIEVAVADAAAIASASKVHVVLLDPGAAG